MSISAFLGIETALRGLVAQQSSLNATAHNIANANTPGYTRQAASLQTTGPLQTVAGQVGTGVEVVEYTRLRDQFLDVQLHAQTMLKGYQDARENVLAQVELAVNEPTDTGVSTLLSKFWSSWQDLASAPENVATRQALLQSGDALAQGLQSLRSQLDVIASQTGQSATLTVGDIQQKTTAILDCERQIATGQGSNDLLDRRDALLDDLGKLINVQATTDPANGALRTLQIGGQTVYDSTLAVQPTLPDEATLTGSATSGKLAGLVAAQATVVGYRDRVDGIAVSLRDAVNAQQAAGNTLYGTTTAVPFFTGSDASDLAVAPALFADPKLIAAASATSTGTGDGSTALAVASLRGTLAIDGSYNALVTTVGSDSQEAQRSAANAKVLVDALENRRTSISGVSLDEEMTNLVRFQRAYQSTARALTAMDDMISYLISSTGRVGL
jgi:flagellar hook-associated protein 1